MSGRSTVVAVPHTIPHSQSHPPIYSIRYCLSHPSLLFCFSLLESGSITFCLCQYKRDKLFPLDIIFNLSPEVGGLVINFLPYPWNP